MRIKNIIFDLGGVLLNIDYHATIKAFVNLGITNFEALFSQASQDGIFDKLDVGKLSPEEFRNNLRRVTGLNLSDNDIDKAWNAMLLDMPIERIELLENAKKHYRTFLLSNTNAIHYPEYSAYMASAHGYSSLAMLFEKQYLSHEIGMRKPDKKTFLYVLKQNGLKAKETLFIDDTLQHVIGAREAGLYAYYLNTKNEAITDLFTDGLYQEFRLEF